MPESKTVADYIVDYWPIWTAGAAVFAGWIELKLKVRMHGQELVKVKEDVKNVEAGVDETVKDIRGEIAKVGESLTNHVNELRHDMREDQRETNSSVREILTILSKRGD